MLQIMVSPIDDSGGIIYDHNIITIQATEVEKENIWKSQSILMEPYFRINLFNERSIFNQMKKNLFFRNSDPLPDWILVLTGKAKISHRYYKTFHSAEDK